MSTLVDFLLARIAEDEAAPPMVAPVEEWRREGEPWQPVPLPPNEMVRVRGRETPDPRWLAECEAKRRIVLDAQDRERGAALAPAGDEMIAEVRLTAANLYDDVIRTLAAVYADHPDFREEWRP